MWVQVEVRGVQVRRADQAAPQSRWPHTAPAPRNWWVRYSPTWLMLRVWLPTRSKGAPATFPHHCAGGRGAPRGVEGRREFPPCRQWQTRVVRVRYRGRSSRGVLVLRHTRDERRRLSNSMVVGTMLRRWKEVLHRERIGAQTAHVGPTPHCV